MHVLGAIFILIGIGILLTSKSAIHEIEAFIVLLIGVVLMCSGSVVHALEGIRKEILLRWPEQEEHPLYQSSGPSNRTALLNGFVIAVLIMLALALISSRDRVSSALLQWLRSGEQSETK